MRAYVRDGIGRKSAVSVSGVAVDSCRCIAGEAWASCSRLVLDVDAAVEDEDLPKIELSDVAAWRAV